VTQTLRTIALTLAAALAAGNASAQTKPSVPPKAVVPPLVASPSIQQIQARREYLFNVMLAKPDNLDAAFEYAALSSQVGDLEAAISTLERMLIFAPGLPRLQLELGVLYYRMAAFETARGYFQAALSGPDVPPQVRARVDQYLADIDQSTETTRFTGQVRAGIRYQTNANRSPTDSVILLNGFPFILDAASQGSPDGNVFATGVFHLSYDLPSQGDSMEIDLITYASKQFERTELDLALAELTFGPAFDLGRFGIDRAALGVYGIASGVVLDGNFYSSGIGAGSRFVIRPTPQTSFLGAVEYRHKDYHDSDSSPTASLRDGDELRAYANVSYIMSPTTVLAGTGYIQRVWADRGYLSYTEGGFSGGPRVSFASPISSEMPKWTAALTAGAVFREYDDPDPIIDPTSAASDWEAFVGGGLTVPLKRDVALITELEYRYVDSNYDTRQFDNFSISLSVAKSF
jgi:tetratricopeptide (TPR) repeat protein